MGLNSFAFVGLFLPVVALLYRMLMKGGNIFGAKVFLLSASLFFYVQSGLRNMPYLLGSLLFNYAAARIIRAAEEPAGRRWLILALSANVAFLCCFKYVNFLLGGLVNLPSLAFPLGVSFFTIQQIMYLVDCYEEMCTPSSLLDHAVFTTFFAYITAGPITRARDVISQLQSPAPRDAAEDTARAITLFTIGLFKKVVFADAFASLADAGFNAAGSVSMIPAWIAAFAFTFQIYFDFSGYSDMAVASALLLGIRIPVNFDNPLRSLSMTEFWRRWHISLSNFITTYLYTPIVKSFGRVTIYTSMAATILAMTIAGLWHGAAGGFVVFGIMHGVALAGHQYWKRKKYNLPDPLAWFLTILWVTLALVFFHSPTLSSAGQMFAGMAGLHGAGRFGLLLDGLGKVVGSQIVLCALAGAIAAFLGKPSTRIADDFRPSLGLACAVTAMLVTAVFFMNSTASTGFIYAGF